MTYQVTRSAQRDLQEIYLYTSQEWGRRQGDLYLAALRTRFSWLRINKPLWRARTELGAGIYSYMHERHVIVFKEDAGCLQVLRVLHERMELDRHVGEGRDSFE